MFNVQLLSYQLSQYNLFQLAKESIYTREKKLGSFSRGRTAKAAKYIDTHVNIHMVDIQTIADYGSSIAPNPYPKIFLKNSLNQLRSGSVCEDVTAPKLVGPAATRLCMQRVVASAI
jgi:hypothetical protein